MKLRPIVFWAHLGAGVIAGLVIFMMSATGVLLTYERQILDLVDRSYTVDAAADQIPLEFDEVLDVVRSKHPDEHHFFVRFVKRPGGAVHVWAGENGYLLHPYSGDVMREGPGATFVFFRAVTLVHRWFALEGGSREVAKSITAYSNLLFLFLIVSGVYIWLPRAWRWLNLRSKIFFNSRANNSKARDFNWHHVFGFWALLPLLLIVVTATIFHFEWANKALYGAFGEELPEREAHAELTELVDGDVSYQTLLDRAIEHASRNGAGDYHSIWVELGEIEGQTRFYIDRSLGRRPKFAYSLYLDNNDASVIRVKRHNDWSRGDQAWDVARFLHTGEHFGIVGQTIAGLASLAACLLVYTGFALAWRRLITPLLR